MTKPRRKTRREQAAALREKAAAAAAKPCEKRDIGASSIDTDAPIPGLTRKRMAFAMCWAEADPEDSMGEIARRAGYSESSSVSGLVSEMARDPNIIKMRDRRLAELQKVTAVTVEDTLLGLRALARDPSTPAKDKAAAFKTILAWYSSSKGQHKPEAEAPAAAKSTDDWAREMQIDVLGIALDEPA